MIKTLTNLLKQDKEKFVVPKGVQDCIPITAIYDDGIFRVGKDKYSKSFKFTDINFAVASREDKEAMFLEYSELLNSLDSGATTKLTINNRRLNRLDFEKTILIPETGDELDVYREEYNKMLLDKATGANAIVQDKYVTISINKKSVEDARTYFARVGADLIAHFARLGSKCVELETDERLRIVHDFFRVGEETAYHFNIKETRKKGHDFKDYVCPDTMEFEKDYFKMGNRYGRVLFLREYASYIKDSMVAELTDLNRNLMMSIDIVPVPTDEAVREAESRLLGVETNITNWQRKQNQNNNFSATVPYDMEQQKKEMKEFLDDLTTRDQRMMFAVLTMVHTADSKEQLDNDTEALLTTARKHLCQFAILKYQQMDGLNTAMPFGTRKIDAFRTLTTESLAVFIPFRVQDIYHENGIYYGQNVISKNMIIADRRQLLNGNSFILGVSGGGKSFAAKGEIENIILSSNADVIIIDPEREYSQLVKALGGEIINISATSPSHINAMDMNKEYGDGANPVILKSEFIMSLCEQLIGGTNLGAKQKSIIDRCTASVYRDYQQRGYTGTVPTLQDFRAELLKQDEPEAKEIALAIELFTHGSLNTFAKPTNVDTDNRLICYDILDLGKQLMPIGMLVVLDSILNRITQNRAKGKQTFIFIDEIYLLFQHEYSANFLFTLWKRVRKYGAYATGITQNVDDLLQSHTARTMLANSEFLIMLNQASTDRIELAKLLNISLEEASYGMMPIDMMVPKLVTEGSYIYDDEITKEDIKTAIRDNLSYYENMYGYDYVAVRYEGTDDAVSYRNITDEIERISFELELIGENEEQFLPDMEFNDDFDEEYDEIDEFEDDEDIDPAIYDDPILMVKWLESRQKIADEEESQDEVAPSKRVTHTPKPRAPQSAPTKNIAPPMDVVAVEKPVVSSDVAFNDAESEALRLAEDAKRKRAAAEEKRGIADIKRVESERESAAYTALVQQEKKRREQAKEAMVYAFSREMYRVITHGKM